MQKLWVLPLCKIHPLITITIPCNYVTDINSRKSLEWIREKNPDVIFCFGWSRLLKEELLKLTSIGVIGYHPAALPSNRGRHPLIWALVLGLKETASTFFFMEEGVDSGDILSQVRVKIEEKDDASTLYEKITCCALNQIEEFLPQLSSGNYSKIKQEHGRANTWRKRTVTDGKIDWRMSARSIKNLIRGLTKPYIGAHFMYKDNEIKVWKAEVIADVPLNYEPGKVIDVKKIGATIKCGEEGICLLDTEPEFIPEPGEYL